MAPLLIAAIGLAQIAAGSRAPRPRAAPTAVAVPPHIPPLVPGRPADGRWYRTDSWVRGAAPILLTTFAFDRAPGDVAYVAWLRAARTQLALYPGYKGPGPTTLPRGPEQVPPAARGRLLATFNSGFYESDSPGGFSVGGLLYFPMLRDRATVLAHADGRVDIVRWTAGSRPGPGIVMARQNLALMVDRGRPAPGLDVAGAWGSTLGGAPAVWRTGLGVDRNGNLLYLAAPNQTAPTLARLLAHVGAVRAMELDINPEWPILVTYGGRGAAAPRLFVPNPNQIPTRFLYPSTKDFFAVYLRSRAAGPEPF